ncbi:DUF5801 repeats-in-toxin domain-containing protein [Sphingopyxis sp. R3-92]|uniref:DUF5801 repeats-in-toxin domain-containing protein n=1 Tax=Sphingopyxis sp. R3-92 TaxID=3158553 RepID=UPI003EE6C485
MITDAAPGDLGDGDNGADTPGADGAAVSAIASVNLPANTDSDADGTGNFQVNGQYGVLTINTDGSYTYVRNAGTPGGVTDTFRYTLTDGDGDTATTTLAISIGNSTPVVAANATVLLDDDALAGGNPNGVGDDVNSANTPGTLSGSGGDGVLTFALLATGTPPTGFTYELSGGNLLVKQGATTVLTVTLTNPATGDYTVTQNAPIVHAAGNDENNQLFTLNYTVTDVDGDGANGTLSINVDDDTPTVVANAIQPMLTVDESDFAGNASTSFGSVFTTSFGADGAATANATTYALGINPGSTGLVDTATGQAVVLSLNGGIVEGRTAGSNALVFTVSVAANGTVTLDQSRAVVHTPNAGPNDTTSLSADNLVTLTATVTDRDGDSATATANIGQNLVFTDDAPTVTATAAGAAIALNDETATTSQTSTIDTGAIAKGDDLNVGGTGAISVASSGSAVVTAAPVYGADGAATVNPLTYALTVTNAASGLTVTDGSAINLVLVGNVIVGQVSGGAFNNQAAFAIEINPLTGVVRVEQYLSLNHPVTTNPDDTVSLLAGRLGVIVTATDRDGDTATSGTVDISAQIRFDDDGPSVNLVATDTDNVLLTTRDAATIGAASDTATSTVNFGGVFTHTSAPGSDGAGAVTLNYALSLIAAPGTDSGLDSNGLSIFLYTGAGGTIVGSTSATSAGVSAANTIFSLGVNAGTGAVTLTQHAEIDHAPNADIAPPYDDQFALLANNLVRLTGTATIVDADGDSQSSTASIDLGNNIRFADDGPSITVGAPLPTLTVDESDLGTNAVSAAVFTPNFGADGPGTVTYALGINTGSTGLVDSATGQAVVLSISGGQVVGRAGTGAGDPIVFTISVDAGGTITLDQQRAIMHANGGAAHDDAKSLAAANLVTLTATVTDGDGDSAKATINLGDRLSFEDDGPTVTADSGTTTETTLDFNAAFVLDFSGSLNTTELNAMLNAVRDAGLALFGSSSGDVSIRLVGFASSAISWGPFTDPVSFIQQLDALNPSQGGSRPLDSNTNFSVAINELLSVYTANPTANNQVFFLSDGNPNEGTGSNNALNSATATAWNNFVNNNGVNVTAIGVGDGISNGPLQNIDVDGQGTVLRADDFDALVQTLLDAVVALPVSGDLDANDNFGADGGRILSITISGTTYTWDGNNTITRSGALTGNVTGSSISATTPQGAMLTLNFVTGIWSYAPDSTPTAATEVFNYSVIDRDGDTAGSTLSVTVVEGGGPGSGNIAAADIVITNASGSGAAIQIAEAALLANDQAGTTITGGATSVTDATGVTRGGGNFTFTDNDTDGGGFFYSTTPTDTARVTVNRAQAGNGTLNGTSANDILVGRDGADDTLVGKNGSDYMYGLGGNDTFNLANGNFGAGEYIDGGAGTDAIVLTNQTTVNFTTGTIVSVETLTGSSSSDTVTMSAQQWAGFNTINLAGGNNDVLTVNVSGSVNISGFAITTVSNTETGSLSGSSGADALTLTGAQLNAILIGSGTINLGGGTDTIVLTSTSTDLNGLNDASLSDVEVISAAGATSGVTISLGNQAEAITIIGSANDDAITASNGNGSIVNAGAGADRVTINVGNLSSRNWTVDLGSDTAADKIIFNHNDVLPGDNTVAIVNNFNVAQDKIAIAVDGTSETDGTFLTVTGTQTNIGSGIEVIELVNNAWVTASLGDDGNGSTIEGFIQAATNTIPTGTYTFIVYSDTSGTANAGIYSVTISSSNNPGNSGMVVEHIMTINDVGYGSLSAANFVGAGDPIILDLNGDGYSFGPTAAFDLNADGAADNVTWNSSNDGILAVDLDGNGMIDNGTEIFTPDFAGGKFANGVAALASLDDNGDGVIDANDAAFAKLLVWQDANANGVSEEGELSSLTDQGIASIATGATSTDETIDGQAVTAHGSFTRNDGSTGGYIEVQLDTQLGARGADREAEHAQRASGNQALTASLVAASLVAIAQGAQAQTDTEEKPVVQDAPTPVPADDAAAQGASVAPVETTPIGGAEDLSATQEAAPASTSTLSHSDDESASSASIDDAQSNVSSDDQGSADTDTSDALFDMVSVHADSPMDGLLTLGLAAAEQAAAAVADAAAKGPAAEAVLAEVLKDGGLDHLLDAVVGNESQHAANDDAPAIDLAQFLSSSVPGDMGALVHQSVEQDLHQIATQV